MSETLQYPNAVGAMLTAELYRPNATGPRPYLVDVHGGAWGSGDRFNNQIIHEDLAAHGVGVFALDFRLSSEAQYPEPVRDINYGVRWFRQNHAALGIEFSVLGALGSSSGAQQLGLIALAPQGKAYGVSDDALAAVDPALSFFIGCWPILNPLARYEMVKANNNERIIDAHGAYFPDEQAMVDGNPHLLLARGEATNSPRMLIIQGTADANVDHERADDFAALYRSKGGQIDVYKFENAPHTFVTNQPDTDASDRAIALIRDFALAQSA